MVSFNFGGRGVWGDFFYYRVFCGVGRVFCFFFLFMFVMFLALICNVLFMISFLFSVEQENDLLVCGVCQTNFPLQDIIKFIRHKVTRCNKENVDVETSEFEDGEEPDPESLAISSKRTSISAPITRKEQMENRLSPRPSSESNLALKDAKLRDDNSQFNVFSDRDRSARSPFRTSTNDISCNTEITGRYSSQIDIEVVFLSCLETTAFTPYTIYDMVLFYMFNIIFHPEQLFNLKASLKVLKYNQTINCFSNILYLKRIKE